MKWNLSQEQVQQLSNGSDSRNGMYLSLMLWMDGWMDEWMNGWVDRSMYD